jgi:hypothetical protein
MRTLTFGVCALVAACGAGPAPEAAQPLAPQNPSPMVERTRAHERIPERDVPGIAHVLPFDGPAAVTLFVPAAIGPDERPRLLVHFHGAGYLAQQAAAGSEPPYVVVTVHMAAGSDSYDRAFSDPAAFQALMDAVAGALSSGGGPRETDGLTLTAFSAGHGAVRAILRHPRHFDAVDAVLLLDGLHTGYVPPRTVLAEGGDLDPGPLESVVRFARAAAEGRKRLLITHSEIFPGTFASTTETTDRLIDALGLRRAPVLAWGPQGMQQLSSVRCRGLEIRGFAGNTAPDHVDHFHALGSLLGALEGLGGGSDCDGGAP